MLARRCSSLASLLVVAGLVGCASADDSDSEAANSHLTSRPSDEAHQAKYNTHLSGAYDASATKATVHTMIEKEGNLTAAFFAAGCTFTFSGKLEGKTAAIRATDATSAAVGTLTLLEEPLDDRQRAIGHMQIKLTGALSSCSGGAKALLSAEGVEITNRNSGARVESLLTGYRIVARRTTVLQPVTLDPIQKDSGKDAVLEPGDVVRTQYDLAGQPEDTIMIESFRTYGIFGTATGVVKLEDLAAE